MININSQCIAWDLSQKKRAHWRVCETVTFTLSLITTEDYTGVGNHCSNPLQVPLYKECVCFFLCICVTVFSFVYQWIMTVGVHVSLSVCVFVCAPVCERQRVLNMCWRSQRNSRALIRTSPGWQLVNSVLRIGVLYSHTKECKLVPVPSGHWERIHMAHTLTLECTLRVAPQCNFPQSKEKQAGLMTRPTRTAVLFVCVWVCASVSRERMCPYVRAHTHSHTQTYNHSTQF